MRPQLCDHDPLTACGGIVRLLYFTQHRWPNTPRLLSRYTLSANKSLAKFALRTLPC